MQETQVRSLGQEDPQEQEMATHSTVLDWKIPWTQEPGGLQSMGLHRVGHDWLTDTFTFFHRDNGDFSACAVNGPTVSDSVDRWGCLRGNYSPFIHLNWLTTLGEVGDTHLHLEHPLASPPTAPPLPNGISVFCARGRVREGPCRVQDCVGHLKSFSLWSRSHLQQVRLSRIISSPHFLWFLHFESTDCRVISLASKVSSWVAERHNRIF